MDYPPPAFRYPGLHREALAGLEEPPPRSPCSPPCSVLSQQQKALLSFPVRTVLHAPATCLSRNLQRTGV